MTAQVPDKLVYQRHVYALSGSPLEDYFANPQHPRLQTFEGMCSACWRGYTARWSIRRGKLYLLQVQPFAMPLLTNETGYAARRRYFAMVFGDTPAPVFADWYTGELHLGWGASVNSPEYQYAYENEYVLQVHEGVVMELDHMPARAKRGKLAACRVTLCTTPP